MLPALLFLLILAGLYILIRQRKPKTRFEGPIHNIWKKILHENVLFYRQLNPEERQHFELRIQHFLNTTRITGIKTRVTLTDELLVASSAIIPVFYFPDWEYINLREVLLYPASFNDRFGTSRDDSNILGMVGSGYMNGKMILSKPALYKGFDITHDKKNVGIHEFTHLIDMMDGSADGVPEVLMDKQYVLPWMDLVVKSIAHIHEGKSDINPYGGSGKQEFFAVLTEYFFERPHLLKRKHPELYAILERLFKTPLRVKDENFQSNRETGRNDPCPCGSGKKFKLCCLKYQLS